VAVVVDASAVVELLIRSPAATAVEAAMLADAAFAPALLDVEVVSVLASLERGGRLDDSSSRLALQALLDAPITRVPHLGLLEDAWELRANLSIYDGLYVSLAKRLDSVLLTGDRRLARAPSLGVGITLLPT
jgi:predicted nucleic acid-binding protein